MIVDRERNVSIRTGNSRFNGRLGKAVLASGILAVVQASGIALAGDSRYEVLADLFVHPPTGFAPDSMIKGSNGNFYGTTAGVGNPSDSTIFEFDSVSGLISTLHVFQVSDGYGYLSLIEASDGSFYGTTCCGGAGGRGGIFRFTPGAGFTPLHFFAASDGGGPAWIIEANDGHFYGTTEFGGAANRGTLFRFDRNTERLTTLHSFDFSLQFGRAFPRRGLAVGSDGSFYGMTVERDRAAIFKYTVGSGLTVLHSFDRTEGRPPESGLIVGSDGSLYGTTSFGGSADRGALFRFNATSGFSILHSFEGSDGTFPNAGLVEGSDGSFYGTTRGGADGVGTIFKFTAGSGLITLHSFQESGTTAGVIEGDDGSLFGVTTGGGVQDRGTVFQWTPDLGLITLDSFQTGDGGAPVSLLEGSDGSFYGTSRYGHAGGLGSIFKYSPAAGLTTLHSFQGTDGAYPNPGLIEGNDGRLYGTTSSGGAMDRGTLFRFTPGTGLETLHSFRQGRGSVTKGGDGSLYGATEFNSGQGAAGAATIFKVDTALRFLTLYTFQGSEAPVGGLVAAADGSLYGISRDFGPIVHRIFRFTPGSGLTTLHSLNADFRARIIASKDGTLYGITEGGGALERGSIFRFDPASGLTTLYSFRGSDGHTPDILTEGHDGNLYGTTLWGGDYGLGTVFKFIPGCGLRTTYSFQQGDGSTPTSLVAGSDGHLYGAMLDGGKWGGGLVFRLHPGPPGLDGNDARDNCQSDCNRNGLADELDIAHHISRDCNENGVPDECEIEPVPCQVPYPYEVLATFGAPHGWGPVSRLIEQKKGDFYGATFFGGQAGYGTIFKLTLGAGLATLHHFGENDDTRWPFLIGSGSFPFGGLVAGEDGTLYGTAKESQRDEDKLFEFVPRPAAQSTLITLTRLPGCPMGLIRVAETAERPETLYGVSLRGGDRGSGSVFQFTRESGLSVLHSFGHGDGYPSTLLYARDGSFYGASFSTIFKFTPGSVPTTLHRFGENSGEVTDLIEGSDGNLYGTSRPWSSVCGDGMIFRLTPGADADSRFTTLHCFESESDGHMPLGLVEGSDGDLYGTTRVGGARNRGTVFKLSLASEDGPHVTILHHFWGGTEGEYPSAKVIVGSDGWLYGTTGSGNDPGVVFRLDAGIRRLPLQLPGDCNQDGQLDISDALCLLGYLFLGRPSALPCGGGTGSDPGNAALLNFNGDTGGVDVSDVIAMLHYLFLGGPAHVLGKNCIPLAGCPDISACHR
jgi:uncharacterized repeat protein (TIGR03803 family)